jgi:hypothetical protein
MLGDCLGPASPRQRESPAGRDIRLSDKHEIGALGSSRQRAELWVKPYSRDDVPVRPGHIKGYPALGHG